MAKLKQKTDNEWGRYSVMISLYDAKGEFIDTFSEDEVVSKDAYAAVARTAKQASEAYENAVSYTLGKVDCTDGYVLVAD